MRSWPTVFLCATLLLPPLGCAPLGSSERNAFLTLTETFGTPVTSDETERGLSVGVTAEEQFRRSMTVTFANNNPDADLAVSFAAWVSPSSIRSAAQQEALLTDGYVQLSREVRIGTVFTLPPGTFVYNGVNEAVSTAVRLGRAALDAQNVVSPTEMPFTLITPDVILAFSQPPVSCDTPAFAFESDGEVETVEAGVQTEPGTWVRTSFGIFTSAYRTLAQIDVYQCDPLRPGLFLKLGGGARLSNEYFEGENVRFDFLSQPTPEGDYAQVTIS